MSAPSFQISYVPSIFHVKECGTGLHFDRYGLCGNYDFISVFLVFEQRNYSEITSSFSDVDFLTVFTFPFVNDSFDPSVKLTM